MTRGRGKFVSRSTEMAMASLKICWYIHAHGAFAEIQDKFAAMFCQHSQRSTLLPKPRIRNTTLNTITAATATSRLAIKENADAF